ncbi:hypothetical protein [Phaeodactylibacter xiamenensis]|nr:hypothetical protein [Phaeodactylibacter xiamenensis]
MGEVLDIIREGITVNIAFDTESAIILGTVLFLALVLALAFYGKVIM